MALLDNSVALTMTASLIIQIIVIFLLIYGFFLKRKLKFRQHGIIMAASVVLHLSMIFYIMIPSFVLGIIPYYIVPTPLEIISIIGLLHGILGIAALALGIWLVVSWRFRKDLKECFRRKKTMMQTLTAWIASLALGIVLYTIFIEIVLTS